jgi:hypothetical protein
MSKYLHIKSWRWLALALSFVSIVVYTSSSSSQPVDTSLGDALDNTSLTWTTGGDANWFGQNSVYYFGGDSAQSGDIGEGQESWIETTVTGPGALSFAWSANYGYTWLSFHIDDVFKTQYHSGGWRTYAVAIPSGNHTLRWKWEPHLSGKAAYLDNVSYKAAPAILISSPNGGEAWEHREAHTIQWAATPNSGDKVRLEVFSGDTKVHTITAATTNDGEYLWYVPTSLPSETNYRVKVSSVDNPTVFDKSDQEFTINQWAQSVFGGLMIIDGEGTFAQTADQDELDVGDQIGESLTIEVWFYANETGDFSDLLSIVDKPDSYSLYARRYTTGLNQTLGCIGTFPSGFEVCESPPFSYGWHHAAVVYDFSNDELRLYLDGDILHKTPKSYTSLIPNTDQPLQIGFGELSGAVDEVRISDIVRYTGDTYPVLGVPFTCDENTRALWHFNEGQDATTYNDSCGKNNTLTIQQVSYQTEVFLPLVITE